MAHSSPEGIILGKGSTLQSLDLSINKEKVLSIKQQDKKLYSEEEVKDIMAETWIRCVGNDGNDFKELRDKILEQFINK